jgi:hypothetical protein
MLQLKEFERIGKDGVGNERSKNAQSMAYFNGYLYLGVTHHNGEGPMDSARILRYLQKTGEWEEVYRSPLVEADTRATASHIYLIGKSNDKLQSKIHDKVPLYRGYRGMVVFQGKSDKAPVLYVGTISHWGAQILRSEDGINFEAVSEPGLGNPDMLSFRNLVDFNGKLFAAHTGSITGEVLDRNFSDTTTIYATDDPASGNWQEAMPTSFGDENNKAIFGMTVFNGCLYAGTGNPARGFQIWKTAANGNAPYEWEPVLVDGAYRYNLNEVAISMTAYKGALYIGTGIPGLGYDKTHDVGPAAAELIRLNTDGSWDLIVGSPRFTPDGLKVPYSAMGPGFDDFDNTVLWSMGVHNDSLYIGTNNVTPWKYAMRGEQQMKGGSQFWATDDGENWKAVTMDGFGNHFAIGIRTMVSTPEGFFVGTSNHQEVEKLWYKRTRKSGSPGVGGLEIWFARNEAS